MALDYLEGLPTQGPYDDETVDRVKGLLNSGVVDVDDVSNYFNVDKSVVIQNLTGISPDAYKKDTRNLTGITVENVDAIEKLIKKGVASSGDIADYFEAPQEIVERHLVQVRGYNPTALETARAGGQVQDANRFASYQSTFGDKMFTTTDPAGATIRGEVQRVQLTPEQIQAEAANILNRAQSPSEIARGMRNLTAFAANPTEDVLSGIERVSGVPASAGLTQDRAWSEFEFRPRMRPYFGPEGQTAGGPQLVTGRSAEATIAENAARAASTGDATGGATTAFGGGALGGATTAFGGGALGGGASGTGGGALGGGASGTGFYAGTGLGTDYATGSEIPTGLRGSEMALKGGAAGAIEMLDQLNRAGRADLETQYGRGLEQAEAAAQTATGFMQPYEQAGQTALQQQLALSGALGQEAFNEAYQESPQMAFLREQGMRANLAGAAATGGLGGGNVQKELQRFGQGLASQGLQQQIGNLGALSGQGYGAAGTMANIATGLGSQQLQTQTGLGQQLAGYGLSTGLPAAQTISGLGTNLASGRTRAGEMLASQYGQTAGQLAGVYSGQGRDIASMTDQQRRMIMDAVNSGAMTEAQAQQAYSTNMANLQSGVGSQLAGVPNAPIVAPNYGQQIGQAFQAGGVGAYISDMNRAGPAPVSTSVPVTPTGGINLTALPGATPTYTGFQNPLTGMTRF